MFSVANLREKIILQVFTLGLRARDASRLEWKLFDILDQEAPIPITIRTKKEGVNCYTFISKEFKELLATYIPNLDKSNKYLLQTMRRGHMDEESLNWTLKNLADRSNLKSKRKLHWHLGRKLVMRTSAQLGINQWNCKMLVGKSVPKDIETYINGIQLKEDFVKLHNVLRLKPEEATQQSRDLKEALRHVEEENTVFKTRVDELQKHVVDIKKRLKDKDSMVKELSRNVDDLRLTVTKLVEGKNNEAFKNAYGYLENHASRLEAIVQDLQDRLERLEGKPTMEESISTLDTPAKRKTSLEKHRKLKRRHMAQEEQAS
jgi:ribosome recycling factor